MYNLVQVPKPRLPVIERPSRTIIDFAVGNLVETLSKIQFVTGWLINQNNTHRHVAGFSRN